MRTKVISGALSLIMTILLAAVFMPTAAAQYHTVDEVQSLIDGIVDYKVSAAGADNKAQWVNGDLADGAGGASDWYALALSQDGTDISAYGDKLEACLEDSSVVSVVSRQKYALALCAAGRYTSYIADTLDSTGSQGIMSYIYGLHILNNGYTGGMASSEVVSELVSMQLSDGGWALWGEYGDIDVTAMTVCALAPFYKNDSAASAAVDRAVAFLSKKQQSDGGYNSFGSANPESASQVLVALSALGIDCQKDERFIKNGNTVIDGIVAYILPDGSFSHTKDGGFNETATVQAFYSLIAYKRMLSGKTSLLVLDRRRPQPAVVTTTAAATHTTVTTTTSAASETTQTVSASGSVTVEKSTSSGNETTSAAAEKTTASADAEQEAALTVTSSSVSAETVSAPVTASAAELLPEAPKPRNYKPGVIAVIIGAAGVLCIVVFALGKRNYKNFIFIAGVAAAAVVIVLVTDVRTKDEYYHGGRIVKDDPIGTVTLEIRCDTIAGKSDSEFIPDDGVILSATEFEIEEGETVYDILTQAAQTYCIQVENRGSSGDAHGMVYIAGINYIYEYDFGDLSGWVYHVNGITPSRGCGEYELSDGDSIQWLYTCELGKDLDEVYE